MRLMMPLLSLTLLLGCAPHKIPGTDIDDTSETRAVLDLMKKYRSAIESKNVSALALLTDQSFRDDGGSGVAEDDFEYASLEPTLKARLSHVTDLRVDVVVRRIEFDPEAKNARVTYSWTMSFKLPQLTGKTHTENDIKQMLLKRDAEHGWKITSGI